MDIARASIDRPILTWLLISIFFLGGLWAMNTIGRLEDPAFTLKQAIIFTPYPGATAEEVELEVTETLESALQQLKQLKRVTSKSKPGMSEIMVQVQDTYDGKQMPQVWDELRRKIGDAQKDLPPGTFPSIVNDDFGDVFGMFYAITAPGFSDKEFRDLAKFLRRELLTVKGVAKVATTGEPTETIYVDVPNDRLASLGLPVEQVLGTIQNENTVTGAGAIRLGDQQVRLSNQPGFDSVATIEALRIGRPGTTEQISLIDIADVARSSTEIPSDAILFNGEKAITLAVAGVADTNIVEVGRAVDAHLAELSPRLPLGVTLHPIYEQHVVVDEAINSFIISLLLSVAIVIAVLCLTMGWRVGVVVGLTLLLTVLGTVFFMRLLHIEMERISLGALIIAMGMLVDNAIVVAEGMLINMQRGMNARDAASDAAKRTQIPLLGATVIGIMAFAGIGLSPDITGEFLFSLFAVISISLMLSWLLAITATPLLGFYCFKVADNSSENDPYASPYYTRYRALLQRALDARRGTLISLVVLTLICVAGFAFVKQAFFPASNTPLFYINYTLPQGSDIRATTRDAKLIEAYLREQKPVVSVASFIGQGASRFMLTYVPELPNPAYAQMIVRVNSERDIEPLMAQVRAELPPRFANAEIITQRLMFGPGDGAKIEARFSGNDATVLRQLAEQAMQVFLAEPKLTDIRHDWRERELVIVPEFNEARARVAGVGRSDLAQALAFATTGIRAGTYREGDEQIPIVIRPPAHERLDVTRLQDRLVWSGHEQAYVPVTQVIDGFRTETEETGIQRRDRVRTLTVRAEPAGNLTAVEAHNAVRASIEAIPLPAGYALEWGGEYQSAGEAQASLGQQLPISFLVMLIISILLFGKLRQPLVIWLIVPMSICGVTIGLLLTNMPFTFTALLGFLSLSGMLMKNAIVLVEEIDIQIGEGKAALTGLIDASVSRLRPVLLAAVTTILGMLPLLWDAFFASMAITIMGGLAFATVLTMIAVPVLYAVLLGIKDPAKAPA
ncbi:MAG: efflux RND transporter permease subunit [Moraxellaceae bacterium]|nr:efflux RND transporter permease subunit [Moraxellaceae bacterium]MDZ4386224.1 efflux RND transporter permease subunit [Moraxellaceae bacterium]